MTVLLIVALILVSTGVPAALRLTGGWEVVTEKLLWFLPVAIILLLAHWAPGVRAFATRAPNWLMVLGAGTALCLVMNLLFALTETGGTDLSTLGFYRSDLNDALLVLAIGAFAPVAEEFYFRGMAYRYGRDAAIGLGRVPAIVIGLLVTSLLFMTIHDDFAWAYLLQGVGFALLYEFTGTLQAPSFAHALDNSWLVATTAMAAQGFATWVYVLAALCPVIALGLTRLVGVLVRDDRATTNASS